MSVSQRHGTVSPEQTERESQLVERMVASFGATPDPRLMELMQALTGHGAGEAELILIEVPCSSAGPA